ncbi:flavodoxin family protein [Gorillibacterium sp. sgz500922]|uniref:flavodoxin family protein n=1 Tax=Gorillibacterium sp. sgz500922 TaxID=3446694 RepID=UPI003F671D28
MKKIIGLAGSMKRHGSASEYLLGEALAAAREYGVETELLRLADYKILPCDGCGNCMDSKPCHLLNNPEDQLTPLYHKLKEADGFIFSSPVYALSLPAAWKNWIDRCEPCEPEDLDFDHYNYDRVVGVKGKALRGKVAGQIAVAAGPGHEWAMASLLPCYTAVKLSMIASAGISLIEFDGQPGIRKRDWSRPIEEADFARQMARGVGARVATALGFSYFDEDTRTPHPAEAVTGEALARVKLLDEADREVALADIGSGEPLVCFAGSQTASLACKALLDSARARLAGRGCGALIATVGGLPPFITRDFVKQRVRETVGPEADIYFDWDNALSEQFGLPVQEPLLLLKSPAGRIETHPGIGEDELGRILDGLFAALS